MLLTIFINYVSDKKCVLEMIEHVNVCVYVENQLIFDILKSNIIFSLIGNRLMQVLNIIHTLVLRFCFIYFCTRMTQMMMLLYKWFIFMYACECVCACVCVCVCQGTQTRYAVILKRMS